MIKVITYGTYDFLHEGHIKLLERAKALGDYLIVGVTSDDFDKSRGKINVEQSLLERIESVKATGIVDEVIVEEYEGQKIDDIKHYGIDIFAIGSDWTGKFDYLREYCQVVYLERTKGISSSLLRANKNALSLGLVGDSKYLEKILFESQFVNGISITGIYSENINNLSSKLKEIPYITNNYDELLYKVDTVYIHSYPHAHYEQIKKALFAKKHVICESPLALTKEECIELFKIAKENNVILFEALRTAYSTAFSRLILLLKSGVIGEVVSVDSTCTSLSKNIFETKWNSITDWGPTALLPIFKILGTQYRSYEIISKPVEKKDGLHDLFTKVNLTYEHAVASIKVGNGIKSEGELIISGTKGYVYIPAPWWKTDYFELRYENSLENRRYFYQLDGEGIRHELVSFIRTIEKNMSYSLIENKISIAISEILEYYFSGKITVI